MKMLKAHEDRSHHRLLPRFDVTALNSGQDCDFIHFLALRGGMAFAETPKKRNGFVLGVPAVNDIRDCRQSYLRALRQQSGREAPPPPVFTILRERLPPS